MMEKVYRICIILESTDEADLSHFVHYVGEDIENGRLKKIQHVDNGTVDGRVMYETAQRCEDCRGAGEIPVDERDPDSGQMMSGVGVQDCHCKSE